MDVLVGRISELPLYESRKKIGTLIQIYTNMKIAILLNEPYPYGMACTNRIHLYAKGLVELGNEVEIIIPRNTEEPGKIRNHYISGEYENVKFKYACNPVRKKSFIERRIQNFISPINTFNHLILYKPDVILIVANNIKYILLGKFCSIITKAKLIREKSEVPFYRSENLSKFKKIRAKIEFRLFDGLIVISEPLKSFFLKDLSLKLKILIVPILVNISNETIKKNDITGIKPNIVYTGSLINNKDGVLIIIKAFAQISKRNPHLKLIMTGDLDQSVDKEKISSLIDKLKLQGKVELTGYISIKKLHEITSTATVLLLAKPENRQNRYNMATKIGEYLLAGRPAVVSSVDPVCSFLSHRENIFIAKPNEVEIAKEIDFILNNPNMASNIGLSGSEVAFKLFNYKAHTLRINDFLQRL